MRLHNILSLHKKRFNRFIFLFTNFSVKSNIKKLFKLFHFDLKYIILKLIELLI